MGNHIFISHATADDAMVKRLREALEQRHFSVWADSRQLLAGDALEPEIQKAVEDAAAFLLVLTPVTHNSRWVQKELQHALKIRAQRGDACRIVPILLPGVRPDALALWFGGEPEPVAVSLDPKPGGVQHALPDLLAALGMAQPNDPQSAPASDPTPIADLILELSEPAIDQTGGKRRASARAVLIYDPPGASTPEMRGTPFRFTSPLGAIETGEIAWYLERYWRWPVGVFADRARTVEAALSAWGKALFAAALDGGKAGELLNAWKESPVQHRFSVLVEENFVAEPALDDQAKAAKQAEAREAATLLLSLPWELIHDGQSHLFVGARGVRVRRRLPNRTVKTSIATDPPIRVLLVSPRPEDDRASYIDHRVSARPLVEALAPLGDLAELTVLNPPTYAALQSELQRAAKSGAPYHVIHFDGHGVFDHHQRDGAGGRLGLGALVFEHPDDAAKLEERRSDIVDAARLAELIRDHRVPLFFLEACQSAQAEKDPTSSVAGSLLQGGVASVAAMSHSVLVETARRFISVFYEKLLSGERVGQAMLAGQQALKADPRRGKSFTGELKLEDWFVPVLFQEETDPQLIRELPPERVREEIRKGHKLALGRLPEPPPYSFVGRSRELLKVERLLCHDGGGAARHVVLRGEGGEGKTTLGCELARWLVASERLDRAVFVSLEQSGDARTVLWAIGEQLVPDFLSRAGQEPAKAEQFVERALRDHPTLLVLDNCESVLPPIVFGSSRREEALASTLSPTGGEGRGEGEATINLNAPEDQSLLTSAATETFDPKILSDLLALCQRLSTVGRTRLIFTTRTPLPAPFEGHHITIDRLDRAEAIELVGKVLGEGKRLPRAASDVENEQQIEELVESVNCHARSLVLVARELMDRNLPQTTATLRQIMADLHARHPNDRERSLFASVELSLRRLPAELRQLLPPLAVLNGGGHFHVVATVLGSGFDKPEEKKALAQAVFQSLVHVGLAELLPYGYLRLDPALGPALERELSAPQRQAAEAAWADAMSQLTIFLYQQRDKDPQLAATITLLELPNLLSALEYRFRAVESEISNRESQITIDSVVGMATSLEGLLENLGRTKALARVAALREQAAAQLGEWSHARHLAESAAVQRLLDAGRNADAVPAARGLLARAQSVGEFAFPEAAYDLAFCHILLARALEMSGDPQSALAPLAEAQARFQKLADTGNKNAARMTSISLTELADCLRALGQLDHAAAAYEEGIEAGKKRDDQRSVATNRFQLGTVRMLQRRYADALVTYTEVRETCERLGDLRGVATAWHQIGVVCQAVGQYEAAERAYQESLQINVQRGDRPNEASTVGQLGTLYSAMGRAEDAVRFYRQAAEVHVASGDRRLEGQDYSNAAMQLLKLGRHDEARREIQRAIECKKPFGHAAEPWKTFAILSNIERAVGNSPAAAQAREQALTAYLAYRRAGGESMVGGKTIQLCEAVLQAIHQGSQREAVKELNQLAKNSALPDYLKPLLPALQSILSGSRDRALAANPNLNFDDAVELLLLLDRLGTAP